MFKRKPYFVKEESWTTILASNPFITPLTELLARTQITPNQVTILSFIISLGAIYLYYSGKLLWGAIIWQIGFIFDCVDGCLARKLSKTSDFGAKLDHTLDKVKKLLGIIAIIYATRSQYNLALMLTLIVLHYSLHQIKYKRNHDLIRALRTKGIESLFDPLDEQFFILFLGPLTGFVFQFVIATVVLQLLNRFIHFGCNRLNL